MQTENDTDKLAGAGKYFIVIMAVAMQLCLGATYSWSVYVASIREITGLGQGSTHWPFTVFYWIFPGTLLIAGVLLSRLGPRQCAMLGGILFGGGWMLASLGAKHYAFTIAGIGLLGGIGVGFAYLVPISVCVQWFPRNKGLVAGIALAGFGGSAAIVGKVAGYLMLTYPITAFDMFRILGMVFLVIVTLTGITMRYPKRHPTERVEPLAASAVLSEKYFWLLNMTMFTGLVAGFTVNANMTKLYSGPDAQAGVTAVILFAIASATGRVLWGSVCDRIRPTTAVKLNLLAQATLLFVSMWLLQTTGGYKLFAFAAGFNYGGLLVIHASSSARHWGGQHVGQVYGWLSGSNIPAAIAPVLAGMAYGRWGSFSRPLFAIAAMLVIIAGIFHLQTRRITDR